MHHSSSSDSSLSFYGEVRHSPYFNQQEDHHHQHHPWPYQQIKQELPDSSFEEYSRLPPPAHNPPPPAHLPLRNLPFSPPFHADRPVFPSDAFYWASNNAATDLSGSRRLLLSPPAPGHQSRSHRPFPERSPAPPWTLRKETTTQATVDSASYRGGRDSGGESGANSSSESSPETPQRVLLPPATTSESAKKPPVEFPLEDLALATIPGTTFDPSTRSFADDELKPQPIIRKRKKVKRERWKLRTSF